ncbi:MAG: HPr family phosphocarrier protein [Betaproteobacteria bacterium]|jgi:phosphocarrier protein|nr:HPr family phosphocarrier protein [Betaproteobacteria bacterium]
MQIREIRLRNAKGLHARVAARVVKVAGRFRSRVVITVGERRANARSIMAVLMLAAAMGATVRLETEGPDEQAAIEAMVAVLAAAGDRA